MYKGVPASPGIAMGKALVLPKKHRIVKRRIIQDPETEKKRFLEAVEEAKGRIEKYHASFR